MSTLTEKHPYTAHTFDDGQLYITLRCHVKMTILNVLSVLYQYTLSK